MLKNNKHYKMFDPNSQIFNESVISIFTDASVRFNQNKTRQHTVMGGVIVEPFKEMIRKTEMVPLMNSTFNLDVNYAALCAIYHTLKMLLDEENFGKLKRIHQINVYSDNITAIKLIRSSLHEFNKQMERNDLNSIYLFINKQYSEKATIAAMAIHDLAFKLKKPIYAFHIKAHLVKEGKYSYQKFKESFFKENATSNFKMDETKLLDSDIAEMIYNNDIVDRRVSKINHDWRFNK